MGKRRLNPRLPKIYRNYTVEEIAGLCNVHKNTVREWMKQGLPILDAKRPILVLGRELADFLQKKRQRYSCSCKPGEIYCLRCRKPQIPAGDMADYQARTGTQGNLIGICPLCHNLIYRQINLTKLEQVRGHLTVTIPQAQPRINERAHPSLNSDLN